MSETPFRLRASLLIKPVTMPIWLCAALLINAVCVAGVMLFTDPIGAVIALIIIWILTGPATKRRDRWATRTISDTELEKFQVRVWPLWVVALAYVACGISLLRALTFLASL